VTQRPEVTACGDRRFRCRARRRQFNERRAGVLNRACLPSDVTAFAVFCRRHFRPTLRDLSEIMALRGTEVSHRRAAKQINGRTWKTKLLPVMGEELRRRRHGTRRAPGTSWHVDETCLKVRVRWTSFYRAIGRDGNLIDAMLSQTRDMRAAKAFFHSTTAAMGCGPERVAVDGHGSCPRPIRPVLGKAISHRTSACPNNRLEQDHRGIKGRIGCMRGFKSHDAAGRFCREHGELRDLLRPRRRHNQIISASLRRFRFAKGAQAALGIMQNA
jgi:transposase-like protein